jgi:branched-chain amino acid transport system ATP-binding protein
MLRLERVSVAYGKHQALREVSLEARPGETTVILGTNGAGKTTLLNTIGGLLAPMAGSVIEFEGRSIVGEPTHRIVDAGISLVPEGRRLFGELTVLENLKMGAYPARARASERQRLEKQFEIFPRLAERKAQFARTMSGGEQQMLAIARALMCEPKFLLLDEPSLGLSPLLTHELFGILRRITSEGQSVILVEQNVRETLLLADRAYVLENGRIVKAGTPDDLRADQAIQKAYLGL